MHPILRSRVLFFAENSGGTTMSDNKKILQKKKGQHLTYGKRCKIETLLSMESRQHIFTQKSHANDCLNRSDCHRHHVCGGNSCPKNVRHAINVSTTVRIMYNHSAIFWKKKVCVMAAARFTYLGLELIPAQDVRLIPALLRKTPD